MKYDKTLTTSVKATLTHGPLITVEAPAWVSTETVMRAHRAAQRGVRAGRDNQQPSAKALELAKFFASELDRTVVEASWRARMKRWNAANPTRRYDDVRRFRKESVRALRLVLPSDPLEALTRSLAFFSSGQASKATTGSSRRRKAKSPVDGSV